MCFQIQDGGDGLPARGAPAVTEQTDEESKGREEEVKRERLTSLTNDTKKTVDLNACTIYHTIVACTDDKL